ncbi:hypothetical protein [Paenibacillus solani]|uniref:hypothetical protein n=1 Tax=Paenibacillus solani TaxID=1705565 RepID=UPI001A9509A4|nr:hypothetical protein [Paenibacillus solani]
MKSFQQVARYFRVKLPLFSPHLERKNAASLAVTKEAAFCALLIRLDGKEEGIVEHNDNHSACNKREDDTAHAEATALVFDELEAHDKDQDGYGCKGNRHGDSSNPVQNFKQVCQRG